MSVTSTSMGNRLDWDGFLRKFAASQTGYLARLTHEPLPVAARAVEQKEQFGANVRMLLEHIMGMANELKSLVEADERISIYMGCSGVLTYKGRDFHPRQPGTWRYSGSGTVSNRYDKDHKKAGRSPVVVACFVRDDLPPAFRAHSMDQRHLALAYEAALHAAVADEVRGSDRFVAMGERGGGGDIGRRPAAGAVVYVAFGRH